jgi:hypothetical protein
MHVHVTTYNRDRYSVLLHDPTGYEASWRLVHKKELDEHLAWARLEADRLNEPAMDPERLP